MHSLDAKQAELKAIEERLGPGSAWLAVPHAKSVLAYSCVAIGVIVGICFVYLVVAGVLRRAGSGAIPNWAAYYVPDTHKPSDT